MNDAVVFIAETVEQAHRAVTVAYAHSKAMVANGQRVRVTVDEAVDDIGAKQRAFLHGPVLTQIAQQVRMPDGSRYTAPVWKEYFRGLFLPDRWVMRKQPRRDKDGRLVVPKRATPQRERQSTEGLGVKGYSELIDKVIAHAVTEFSVAFDFDEVEREGVRYVRPPRKAKVEQQEEATC